MSDPREFLWVYVPHPKREDAIRLGRTLVEERLVACANVSQPVTSVYEWEGKIQEDEEVILIAKTRAALFDQVRQRIEQLHPYQCPCILGLPLEAANEPYLRWMTQATLKKP